ncbi:MAG: hypothetical protein COW00_12440 [Bdellovibrio sp. CG12_big_fil_rev_8_21_14_0_65_39_13]|nr:MAG: hypothetical protein COW78_20150 [Bdellovibrio sp. CG22_combo_CG10-13_8_21_14_all_39_27]PIQ59077.1 MAG: hypothetical protein COW00_12440 [Bdellovibrio sp. CG12_big_fil_rev_8_21_14_0_65_39_13]PIR33588.1 MAG: hypothetical protein COV37_15665 [Bdellovibrio sp. CG11_big_fil_rev_8_21_14_0_20_39_38]PJB53506.1 MAG: hypothetical protein CO099_06770 [Bdellovibrio sp. CG_4_9_14_3_um_filter_39_7]
MIRFAFYITTLLFLYTFGQALRADELVVIKAVSSSRKRFVIQKGGIDGVSKGQISVFSNKYATVAAKATEVTHTYSMWVVQDPRASFPFDKDDFIAYSNSVDTMILEIPKMKEDSRELVFRTENRWILRGSYAFGLSQSVSETNTNQITNRTSFQFEGLYSYKWGPHWEILGGLRIDRDNATQSEPALDIPTQRTMAAAEILYHFDYIRGTENNIYVGTGFAYGKSQTTVEDTVSAGPALVAPIVKIGYQKKLESGSALLFEAVTESIATSESFTDSEPQTTNVVNAKMSVGYKF